MNALTGNQSDRIEMLKNQIMAARHNMYWCANAGGEFAKLIDNYQKESSKYHKILRAYCKRIGRLDIYEAWIE